MLKNHVKKDHEESKEKATFVAEAESNALAKCCTPNEGFNFTGSNVNRTRSRDASSNSSHSSGSEVSFHNTYS